MEKEIREIGLEKEMFLFKGNEIKEPKLYGFPNDEMGFLVELRSIQSDRLEPAYMTIHEMEIHYKLRANKFDFELKDIPYLFYDADWVSKIAEKYHVYEFTDYTKNIYGTKGSHHTGIFPAEETANPVTKKPCLCRLTSGIHVHFSSRNAKTGEVIQLPIEKIVRKMDNVFAKEIKETSRLAGEWEPKAHGFEYRSLPCDTDIYRILKESFKILRSV